MKTLKKVACLFLAIVMVLPLATTAFATENTENTKHDSITVTSAKAGETYDLYQLFDLYVNDALNPTAYTYSVNDDWAAFFAAGEGSAAGPGSQYITITNGYVTAISDAAALAEAAASWVGKPATPYDSVTVNNNESTAVFSDLPDGYWLITSTLGTIAMTRTTPDQADVTVNEKNPENTIEKEVKEDSTGNFGEENNAQIGDTVEFKSTVKIVKGARNVVVHDTMTSGLTYTADSIVITGLTKGTDYTVDESPADGHTFDIRFVQDWIDDLNFGTDGYKEYVITYTAVLNENAVVKNDNGVAITDHVNNTYVSFGNETTSTEQVTTTTTHKFSVHKHATDSTENLPGAVFSLKKAGTVVVLTKIDDTNYRVASSNDTVTTETFTTVNSGDIVIWGVDTDADYTLEEITPPVGYNALDAEVTVTVEEDNSTRISVENKSGTKLPSTGGIGTTVFYVLGGILVLVSVVLLITKKRMSTAD